LKLVPNCGVSVLKRKKGPPKPTTMRKILKEALAIELAISYKDFEDSERRQNLYVITNSPTTSPS